VREDQDLISVEVGLPGERIGQRTSLRVVMQLVHPIHVSNPARPADAPSGAERSGHAPRPTGRIDHHVGPYGRPVDHDSGRSTATDHHRVDVADDQLKARFGHRGLPQRLLEEHPP